MALRKTILLLIIIISMFCGCVDRLTFYNKDYVPQLNSKLRFDGYYAYKEKSWGEVTIQYDKTELWSNPITPIFFYQDGLTAYHPTHKDESSLKETIIKNKGGSPDWGVYKISNDTLTVEFLQSNPSKMRRERSTNGFIIEKDKLILFMWADRKGRETASIDTLYFHPFSFKTDSRKSYIKKKKRK
jgi:hypothetical protein